jgi:hypothetical protein
MYYRRGRERERREKFRRNEEVGKREGETS